MESFFSRGEGSDGFFVGFGLFRMRCDLLFPEAFDYDYYGELFSSSSRISKDIYNIAPSRPQILPEPPNAPLKPPPPRHNPHTTPPRTPRTPHPTHHPFPSATPHSPAEAYCWRNELGLGNLDLFMLGAFLLE